MKTQGSRPRDVVSAKRVAGTKRAYQQPVIRDYGSVASLTAGNQGSAADGGGIMMAMMPPN